MKQLPFVLPCCLAFAANLVAEDIDTIPVHLEMLGAGGTVHAVEIGYNNETGITLRSAGHEVMPGEFGSLARWFEEPLLIYHSREVGQIAIVQYYEGGGTGYSQKRFFAFCCTEDGCEVLHEDFSQQHSVVFHPEFPDYILESEFLAVPEGFSQRVRLDLPFQMGREGGPNIRYDGFGTVHMRFRIQRGDEGLVTMREIDTNSARMLLDIIELGLDSPREWAVGILAEQWPELDEVLDEYLAAPPSEQAERIHALRQQLEEILSEVTC